MLSKTPEHFVPRHWARPSDVHTRQQTFVDTVSRAPVTAQLPGVASVPSKIKAWCIAANVRVDRGRVFGRRFVAMRGWCVAVQGVLRGVSECGFITNNASSSAIMWRMRQAASFVL
jgi:hypothetical protein